MLLNRSEELFREFQSKTFSLANSTELTANIISEIFD